MRGFLGRHPFIAFCAVVLGTLVVVGAIHPDAPFWVLGLCEVAALGYLVVAFQPHGLIDRIALGGGRVLFVVLLVVIGLPPYRIMTTQGAPLYAMAALQLGAVLGVVVGVIRRRRSPRGPAPRSAFSLTEYAFVGFGVFACHWAFALFVASGEGPEPVPALIDLLRADTASGRGQALNHAIPEMGSWLGLFTISQLTTGLALRALNKTLASDWELPKLLGVNERDSMFMLAIVPVTLCLLPSLAHGALLAGVATRLVTLVVTWAFTTAPPQGAMKTVRAIRRRSRRSLGSANAPSSPSPAAY